MITAIVGLPGSGKTYAMTRWAWMLRRRHPDRRIVSNYDLWLPGERVPRIDDIVDAFELSHCHLLLDELHLWMDARAWNKRDNDPFARWISQLRKRDVDLWYTSQEITSVDKLARDRTAYSYWLESWVKLGFFRWRAYFGVKESEKRQFLSGFYLFNPYIARLYDTNYIVGM